MLLGETRVPLPLLDHLLDCLGNERERASRRVIVSEPLQAVLGFSAAHFHLAGERTLEDLAPQAPQPVCQQQQGKPVSDRTQR